MAILSFKHTLIFVLNANYMATTGTKCWHNILHNTEALWGVYFLTHILIVLIFNNDMILSLLRKQKMRVRTVKGPEYLCRSGAKFHGAMKQTFILLDCHKAIYGSYR